MNKLYEILAQHKVAGDAGVEIEVEGARLPDDVDGRWNATVDNSLRGENREYVMRKPLPVAEVKDALLALSKNLKDNNAKLDFSFRTSVHVHINCQELTYPQYLNLLYTYFLLEEVLMSYCGRDRKGNRFCLRLADAEGMLETYKLMFSMGEAGFGHIPANKVRYSAMNIEATTKYGSLEFRGMRGNMDVDLINDWVIALTYLREFAKSVEDPAEVYNLYAKLEGQGFLDHVLKELAPKFYYARAVRDMQRSFSLSIDLPFLYAAHQKKKKPKAVTTKLAMPRHHLGNIEAQFNNNLGMGDVPMPAPRAAIDPFAGNNDPFAARLREMRNEEIRAARPLAPRNVILDEIF